jgi:hypothetical protein
LSGRSARHAGAVSVRLADLVDRARALAGLSDFGGDSWREGLEVLLHSAREESRFNAQGERAFCESIVQTLANRLRIEHWFSRHPEIAEQEVHVELLGVGFPRTGSTALAQLLGEDPAVRSLRMWEALAPCPPPGISPDDDRARIEVARATVAAMDQVAPRLRSMLPQSATGPFEDHDLMSLEFKAQVYLSMGRLPSYAEWLLDCDMEPTYRYERRVLQLLQWRCPPNRWQLKSPSHTPFLDAFAVVFPEARYVMTHRDPAHVMTSVADLYCTLSAAGNESLDPVEVGELNLQQWGSALDRCMAFRAAGRESAFHDIGFRAFQADPIGEVRGLYDWLGRELGSDTERRMREWWSANRRRDAQPRPDPAQFGFDDAKLAKRFRAYRERFAPLLG